MDGGIGGKVHAWAAFFSCGWGKAKRGLLSLPACHPVFASLAWPLVAEAESAPVPERPDAPSVARLSSSADRRLLVGRGL
jgi:hypothetical protein